MTPLLIVAVVAAAPGPKEGPKKEEPTLVGEWVLEAMTFQGKPVPPGPDLDLRLRFSRDGAVTSRSGGQDPKTATYKVDAKKDPPEIDVLTPDDKNGPELRGIYKLDGDTLTLCVVHGPVSPRPAKFESVEGSGFFLLILKRAK